MARQKGSQREDIDAMKNQVITISNVLSLTLTKNGVVNIRGNIISHQKLMYQLVPAKLIPIFQSMLQTRIENLEHTENITQIQREH